MRDGRRWGGWPGKGHNFTNTSSQEGHPPLAGTQSCPRVRPPSQTCPSGCPRRLQHLADGCQGGPGGGRHGAGDWGAGLVGRPRRHGANSLTALKPCHCRLQVVLNGATGSGASGSGCCHCLLWAGAALARQHPGDAINALPRHGFCVKMGAEVEDAGLMRPGESC